MKFYKMALTRLWPNLATLFIRMFPIGCGFNPVNATLAIKSPDFSLGCFW